MLSAVTASTVIAEILTNRMKRSRSLRSRAVSENAGEIYLVYEISEQTPGSTP
jgi:hypothetical protein